ncbi:MAG TPA: tetratricopeptide repeat protein [Bryobacteraceae bacterium]|jgi:Tfp pilus assembly protein PilF|nr:tetratricopeptide repeat protein [Bryobacteraceae bacterium]
MGKLWKWGAAGAVLLVLNSAYLWAFKSATIAYMGNVLLHLALGLLLLPFALVLLAKSRSARLPAAVFAVAAAIGIYLVVHGNLRVDHPVLVAHISVAALSVALFLPYARRVSPGFYRALGVSLALLLVLPVASSLYHRYYPNPDDSISNRGLVPTSMNEEGGGPKSPFWPSSTVTSVHSTIPSNYFLESKKCGECHADIYKQWDRSVHHFASFNNQFYRKSIEYMQDVQHSTQPSQWCAGCHDHAVLFSGRWKQPIKDQIDTPESQAGLACLSCHAISRVGSSMGNNDYTLQYNSIHYLAVSDNPVLHSLSRFLTYVNPEPHRRTFMKSFMQKQTAEYCSACHKVHLDIPVNNYRWVRGFNDYDNWQASGVSGQGARSFYYPPKPQNCADCHMPMVKANDPASHNGMVHAHWFAAANTAVPTANEDEDQLKRVETFLKSGFMRVDIFAATPVTSTAELEMRRSSNNQEQIASTFAVGEESDQHGPTFLRDVTNVAAPLNRGDRVFEPGSRVRVDVVVRTLKIGHFFPGGTVDAQEAWVELKGTDADRRVVFWSGKTAEPGKGPVDPGAHFYQSVQLDGAGNVINKRDAFETRGLLYVRLIPPGAADVVHYLVTIPKDARGPITFTANLNYRKFTHYYTQYAYAGKPKPGQDPSLVDVNHDDRQWSFDPANIPANVSGAVKGRIPDLPIVVIASNTQTLAVGKPGDKTAWIPVTDKKDALRWNDYGIGLLLQGDLKGAEYAFTKVTQCDPSYSDGYLNIARALIQEGEVDRAQPLVAKAIQLNPSAGRNYYFEGLIRKTHGDYDGALASFQKTSAMFPRDRVVLDQIGRIYFLQRKYAKAVEALHRVLDVDPEDLQCHYNLMLCMRALGKTEEATREETLFRRFKADESATTVAQKLVSLNPEMNNSRQPIHDHVSVPLPEPKHGTVQATHADVARAGM